MSRFKFTLNFYVFFVHLTITIAATTTTISTLTTTKTTTTTYPNKRFPVTLVLNPCAVNPCLVSTILKEPKNFKLKYLTMLYTI